jgi:uncharacterized membrane protein YhaH (DUF805 family)
MQQAFVPFQKYATFAGRARRAEYWQFFIAIILILVALSILDGLIGTFSMDAGAGLLSSLFGVAIILPSLALYVRRLHDVGWSGWWVLLFLVPFVSTVMFFVLGIKDSEVGDNRFGPSPKPKPATAVGAETPAGVQGDLNQEREP